MNLAEKPLTEDIEIKELSPEMLAFVEAHFERLDHIADEHVWLNEHFTPLLVKDIPNRDEGWYISINRKRYERKRKAEQDENSKDRTQN